MVHYITFPGLFDDILTIPTETIFGIKIYAIMIMTGFLIAALYAMHRAKEFNVNADIIADILIFALPAAIVGARLYYVFNKWDYYSQHTDEIIKVWNGGIAIYGAIIAAALVIVIYSKIKKIDMLSLLDLGSLSLFIGQAIGRWGNFFNAEAYGTATDLPWGMVIRKSVQSTGTPVHPTFLYESLWNTLGFIIFHNYSKKRKFKGELTLMYIAWYGLGRAFIEGLRIDSLMLGHTNIRISQLLAAVSCVVSVAVLIYCYVAKKGTPAFAMASEQPLQNAEVIASEETAEEKSEETVVTNDTESDDNAEKQSTDEITEEDTVTEEQPKEYEENK